LKKTLFIVFALLILQNTNAQWTKTTFSAGLAFSLTSDEDGNLYAGSLNMPGVYYSEDDGNAWSDISNGFPQLYFNVIKVFNNNIYVGNSKGSIYKSTDHGASWQKLNTGMDTLTTYVWHLESFENNIFAGTTNKGIYTSTDNGESWQQHNSGIVGLATRSLYASSTDLFAGVNSKYAYRYDSINLSWAGSGNGMPNNSINAFTEAIDENGNKYLFAGLDEYGTEVAVSTDNGINWAASDAGLPNVPVYTFAVVGSNVFLGNYYGVHRSTDFGANWEDIKTGLNQGGSPCKYLTIGKSNLFVIQGGAVWKRAFSDFGITSAEETEEEVPNSFELSQNYPNPFNPSTTIKYSIPNDEKRETSNVKLIVYDILGKEVATLVNNQQKAGNYEVNFNASNLPSGIYFYQISAENFTEVKKMTLLK